MYIRRLYRPDIDMYNNMRTQARRGPQIPCYIPVVWKRIVELRRKQLTAVLFQVNYTCTQVIDNWIYVYMHYLTLLVTYVLAVGVV